MRSVGVAYVDEAVAARVEHELHVAVGLLGVLALRLVVRPLGRLELGEQLGLVLGEQVELAADEVVEAAAPPEDHVSSR